MGRCAQAGGLLALIGYTPDDVYIPTGPLYHSGPAGSWRRPGARSNGGAAAQVRSGGLAAPRRQVQGHLDVQRADTDPHGVQPAGRGEGEVRRVVDEADDRQRRAVELRAEADVPRRLPGRLAVRGVRLDRAGRELRVASGRDQLRKPGSCGKPAPMVEIKLFDDDGNEVTGTGPGAHRRAVREEPERVRRLLQAARPVPERSASTAIRRSATSPTATTRATSTSAIARRT